MESKRQLQVGEMIMRNFSLVLQQQGRFIYGDILVSVTKAIVTPDLAQAKIYISVYGTENKEEVLMLLEENMHQLKQEFSHRIKKHIRRIPELFLYIDDTLDEMYRVNDMLNKIK